MVDLALHEQRGSVQCHDIAARQDIPEPYLNQLLSALRRAQLISSRRGPGGGHQLARPAAAITLREIVDALDGPEELPDSRALEELWRDVGARTREVLEEKTLADLAQGARERAHSYHI